MAEKEKMEKQELENVAGGQTKEMGPLTTVVAKDHWTVTKMCRKCFKQYEATCWSHEKPMSTGVCPECKEKERLGRQ